LAVPPRA